MILDFMRRLPSTMLPFFCANHSPYIRCIANNERRGGGEREGGEVETQGRNERVNETEKAEEKRDARRGSRCVSRRTGRIMLRFALIGEELEP